MQSLQDDNSLLQQIAQGNEQAFSVLFHRHKDKVYNFAFHFTKSVVQSEEIVQEIFLRIWLRKTEFTHIEKFEAWLYMAARNHSFNSLKKIAYDYSYRKTLIADPEADSLESQLLLKEYQQIVSNVVDALPPQQKKIYTLRREGGLKINEIAEELGISPNTVKVHLGKALQHIKQALAGKLDLVTLLIFTSFFAD